MDALNSSYSSVDGVLFNKSQTTLIHYPRGKVGSYTIPNSVTSIEDQAFQGYTGLTSITIGNSVTRIGNDAFSGCTNLSSVTIGNNVTDIEGSAFSGCTSLTSVTIPNSVTTIWYQAFQGCTSLTSVLIPNSVTFIGDSAFLGCTSLTSVTIPSSVTDIGYRAFSRCSSLSAITVEALNSRYSSVEGVLFNKSQITLMEYPEGKAGSYAIPNSVTSIADLAFAGCTILTSVTIPNSVTSIGGGAFEGCEGLKGVYFKGSPPSVTFPGLSRPGSFDGNSATLYYLPGTTGWDSTFAGRPTALWNPQALTSDATFGVRAGQFGFTVTWASDKVIVVEACTDLANPVWSPVGTNTLTGGSSYFNDPEWTNFPTRVYRLRSQ